MRATWKEKTARLTAATVTTLEGPGPAWVCIIRGTRETPKQLILPKSRKGGRR